MRRFLIAAAATLVGTFGAAAADLIVDAPEVQPASTWGSFYAKVYGGVTLENTLRFDGDEFDMDAGWLLGGAIGTYAWIPGLSVELDVTASAAAYAGEGTGQNAMTAMVDLVYSMPIGDSMSAYAGAGLGIVGVQYDNGAGSTYGYGAGGQVFGGLALNVTDNVSLFGEARFQGAFDDISVEFSGNDFDLEFARTAILVGIKFAS